MHTTTMRLVDYDLITLGSISRGCTRDDGGTMGHEYVHEYTHHIDKNNIPAICCNTNGI